MPNSTQKTHERAKLRIWSTVDEDWVAPPREKGGPKKHNAFTYVNWMCRCLKCKAGNNRRFVEQSAFHRARRDKNKSSSGPANAPPSSGVRSDGGGATETDSSRGVYPTGTSGSEPESISA